MLAFAVVAIGGMGSIEGALIGALIVGLARAGGGASVAAGRAVRDLRGDGAGAGLPPLRPVQPGPAAEDMTCRRARPSGEPWRSSRSRRLRRGCRRGWCRSPTIAFANALVVLGLIILWRTGLVPFGQALFYAIGAYAVALIGRYTPIRDVFVVVLAGAIGAGLVAYLVGFLLARYREIFFAMLSLAMSMILYGVLVKTETLGSTDGFHVEAGSFLGYRPQGAGAQSRALLAGARLLRASRAWLVALYFRSVAGSLGDADARQRNPRRVPRHVGRPAGPSQAGDLRRAGRRRRRARGARRAARRSGRWRTGRRPAVSCSSRSSPARARSRRPSSARWCSNWCARLPSISARRMADDPRHRAAAHHPVPARGARLAGVARLRAGESGRRHDRHPRRPRSGEDLRLGGRGARHHGRACRRGQTVGIIGANGAGKTTFVNMITGHLRPSKGSIHFEGRDITGLPSRAITRLGISRSFQVAQVFPTLTVHREHARRRRRSRAAATACSARCSRRVDGAGVRRRGRRGRRAVPDRALSRRARRDPAAGRAQAARHRDGGRRHAAPAAARRADQRHLDRGEVRPDGRGDVGAEDRARSPCCSSSTTWRSSAASPTGCWRSTTAP